MNLVCIIRILVEEHTLKTRSSLVDWIVRHLRTISVGPCGDLGSIGQWGSLSWQNLRLRVRKDHAKRHLLNIDADLIHLTDTEQVRNHCFVFVLFASKLFVGNELNVGDHIFVARCIRLYLFDRESVLLESCFVYTKKHALRIKKQQLLKVSDVSLIVNNHLPASKDMQTAWHLSKYTLIRAITPP